MEKTQKQLNEYRERFKAMSEEELIEAFNGDVGNPGWVSARALFHYALREEFDNRGIDYLDIGNKNSFSWKNKIKLIGKKIIKLNMDDLNETKQEEWEITFIPTLPKRKKAVKQ